MNNDSAEIDELLLQMVDCKNDFVAVAAERLVRNAQPTGTLIIKATTPFTSA
jgi:hypothetical protein